MRYASTKKSTYALALAAALAIPLAACEDSTPTQPDEQATGAVEGQVAQTATGSSAARPTGFTRETATQTDFSTHSAAVARVRADGSLEALAQADVSADGSFRVTDVPAGASGLVVQISEDGQGRGQAVVHGQVPANGTAFVTPVDGETTVEAHVLAELRARGVAPEAINTALLALAIEPRDQQSVDAVLGSTADLQAMAQGVENFQAVYTAVLDELNISVDAAARADAVTPAAQAFAQARLSGMSEAEAERQLGLDVRAALEQAGAGTQAQVEASSAAGTGLARATSNASSEARLDIAKAALEIGLVAREGRMGELTSDLGISAGTATDVQAGLEQALQAIESAQTPAEAEDGVQQAMASIEAVLESEVAAQLSGVTPDDVAAVLDGVPGEAELESRLQNASSPSGIAQAHVSFFSDLRSQVSSQVAGLAGTGGGVNGQAVADFFTSLRGMAQVGS